MLAGRTQHFPAHVLRMGRRSPHRWRYLAAWLETRVPPREQAVSALNYSVDNLAGPKTAWIRQKWHSPRGSRRSWA